MIGGYGCATWKWKVMRLPNKYAGIRAYLYTGPSWRELQLAASALLPTPGPAHCLDAGLGTSQSEE